MDSLQIIKKTIANLESDYDSLKIRFSASRDSLLDNRDSLLATVFKEKQESDRLINKHKTTFQDSMNRYKDNFKLLSQKDRDL